MSHFSNENRSIQMSRVNVGILLENETGFFVFFFDFETEIFFHTKKRHWIDCVFRLQTKPSFLKS